MTSVGPAVRELTRHLSECPPVFLEEPVQPSGHGGVHVHAVISDLLTELGGERLSAAEADLFCYADRDAVRTERNRLRIALLCSWLFAHPDFRPSAAQADLQGAAAQADLRGAAAKAERVRVFLSSGLKELARLVAADALVNDPDRREELVRLGLQAVGLVPGGEERKEAENRLAALSSVERERVVAEAKAAEARARAVQEELARKQAAEAAANPYYNE